MKTAIVIPTLGRAELLGVSLLHISNQVQMPSQVIVVATERGDIPDDVPDYVTIVFSRPGICVQRNVGVAACDKDTDAIIMIDDDTFLHSTYIQEMERILCQNPELSAITGILLKDGGITVDEAIALLKEHVPKRDEALADSGVYGSYTVRKSMFDGLCYDERLVLYGLLEDADFGINLKRRGKVMCSTSLVAVHLMYPGKTRANHMRYGFSQVMNPFYLSRKHGKYLPFSEVVKNHWVKGVPANLIGSIYGADRGIRWQRFKGNLVAFSFLIRGRVLPEYATNL